MQMALNQLTLTSHSCINLRVIHIFFTFFPMPIFDYNFFRERFNNTSKFPYDFLFCVCFSYFLLISQHLRFVRFFQKVILKEVFSSLLAVLDVIYSKPEIPESGCFPTVKKRPTSPGTATLNSINSSTIVIRERTQISFACDDKANSTKKKAAK